MKFLKYTIALLLLIIAGGAFWMYYPQYQINKMQNSTERMAGPSNHSVSYLEYFHSLKTQEIQHLALGDSVIKGIGAGQSKDLVTQFSNELRQKTHKSVVFTNDGIPGITSTELNQLVQNGQYDQQIKKANIITINVGGNDILRLANQRDIYQAIHSFSTLQAEFSNNLTQITNHIVKLNPHATIVYLELYNPLHPDDDLYRLADKLLPKWNVNIYKVANNVDSSIVVQTSRVINDKHLQYLSVDGIHPNSKGYNAISKQMIYEFQHTSRHKSV